MKKALVWFGVGVLSIGLLFLSFVPVNANMHGLNNELPRVSYLVEVERMSLCANGNRPTSCRGKTTVRDETNECYALGLYTNPNYHIVRTFRDFWHRDVNYTTYFCTNSLIHESHVFIYGVKWNVFPFIVFFLYNFSLELIISLLIFFYFFFVKRLAFTNYLYFLPMLFVANLVTYPVFYQITNSHEIFTRYFISVVLFKIVIIVVEAIIIYALSALICKKTKAPAMSFLICLAISAIINTVSFLFGGTFEVSGLAWSYYWRF